MSNKKSFDFYNLFEEFHIENFNSVESHRIKIDEVDVLNVTLFGMTAKECRESKVDLKGNIPDYVNVSYLVILINLENLNYVVICRED